LRCHLAVGCPFIRVILTYQELIIDIETEMSMLIIDGDTLTSYLKINLPCRCSRLMGICGFGLQLPRNTNRIIRSDVDGAFDSY